MSKNSITFACEKMITMGKMKWLGGISGYIATMAMVSAIVMLLFMVTVIIPLVMLDIYIQYYIN